MKKSRNFFYMYDNHISVVTQTESCRVFIFDGLIRKIQNPVCPTYTALAETTIRTSCTVAVATQRDHRNSEFGETNDLC